MIFGSIIFGIGHIGIHLAHKKEVCGSSPQKHIVLRILIAIPKAIFFIILRKCGYEVPFSTLLPHTHLSLYQNGLIIKRKQLNGVDWI
jgi:hypothetical protein